MNMVNVEEWLGDGNSGRAPPAMSPLEGATGRCHTTGRAAEPRWP